MWWFKYAKGEKKLIVMRGISGSGKSTLAQQLGLGGVVLSADEYWGPEYNIDTSRIHEAHQWNINRAKQAMDKGVSPVVIDNTNVAQFEAREYVRYAVDHGYVVEVAEPNTPWKFDIDELYRRNVHNVPKEVIQDMLDRWDHDFSIEAILNSKAPWELSESESEQQPDIVL